MLHYSYILTSEGQFYPASGTEERVGVSSPGPGKTVREVGFMYYEVYALPTTCQII